MEEKVKVEEEVAATEEEPVALKAGLIDQEVRKMRQDRAPNVHLMDRTAMDFQDDDDDDDTNILKGNSKVPSDASPATSLPFEPRSRSTPPRQHK